MKPTSLLIATHNPWKIRLFAPVFHEYGFEMVTLNDIDPHPGPPENKATTVENALEKAYYYHSIGHPWVFGDDARGIDLDRCFDELNLTEPALVGEIHRAYIEAGSQIIYIMPAFGRYDLTAEIIEASR